MKKLVALLCTIVMVFSLSSAVMANGSIASLVTEVTATTSTGETLVATALAEVSPETLSAVIKNAAVQQMVDTIISGNAEEAYAQLVELAGVAPKTTTGKAVDLNEYDAVDVMALIDTEDVTVNPVTGTIEVATEFEMAEGKTVEDYLVAVVNPAFEESADAAEDESAVSLVEPTEKDGKFTYELPFYPALTQILEKAAE